MKIKKLKKISSNISVLYVEDDAVLRKGVVEYLKLIFDDVDAAKNGAVGLELYEKKSYDIVITDIQMPKMNGLEMIKNIRLKNEKQEIILLTAFSEVNYLLDAIALNVSGYILKPLDYTQLNKILYKIVDKISVYRLNADYQVDLENTVKKRTVENLKLEEEKIDNYEKTLVSLVELVEKRDTYTGGHSLRVANYCKLIAQKMGYTEQDCDFIYRAGILHDIGKIETPDAVLLKPGKLDALEFRLIKEHVSSGADMLSKIPMYEKMAKVIRQHHERYDGQGYPKGLQKDEIMPLARIMIVADAFDAMTTNRIYKPRMSLSFALKELKQYSSTQFHPEVVDVAIEALKEIDVDKNIGQLPSTDMEDKRFAFFFEDQLTKAYNQKYLELILIQNQENLRKKHITAIFVHNFTQYNKKFGWDRGDEFLKEIVRYFHTHYEHDLLFRLHGDDFIVISNKNIDVEESIFDALISQAGGIIKIECRKLDTDKHNISSTSIFNELNRI